MADETTATATATKGKKSKAAPERPSADREVQVYTPPEKVEIVIEQTVEQDDDGNDLPPVWTATATVTPQDGDAVEVTLDSGDTGQILSRLAGDYLHSTHPGHGPTYSSPAASMTEEEIEADQEEYAKRFG